MSRTAQQSKTNIRNFFIPLKDFVSFFAKKCIFYARIAFEKVPNIQKSGGIEANYESVIPNLQRTKYTFQLWRYCKNILFFRTLQDLLDQQSPFECCS